MVVVTMVEWSVPLDHVIMSCFVPLPPPTSHELFEAQREAAEFLLIRAETAAVKVSGHCS